MEFLDCGKSEAEDVSDFMHPLWMEVFAPIISGGGETVEYLFSKWLCPDAVRKNMDDGYVYGYAMINGRRKGMYSYRVDHDNFYISKIYLHSELRGKGLGKEMISMLFDIGRRSGCREVTLNVYSENINAIRFYERVGMVKKERVKAWSYGPYDGYDFIMWKSLNIANTGHDYLPN